MVHETPPVPKNPAALTSHDLILYERRLKDALAAFVPFKSYSLYFPSSLSDKTREAFGEGFDTALHLPGERSLMLPLASSGELLGVFLAKGVHVASPKAMLPVLRQAASLCLESLALYKASVTDQATGLYSADFLTAALEREIALVQNCILPGSASCLDTGLASFAGCFGLVLIDVDYYSWLTEDYGFLFAEAALAKAAGIIRELAPEKAVTARFGEDAFAVFWPGAAPAACLDLSARIRAAISAARMEYEITGELVSYTVSCGVACYPHDLHGAQFRLPAAEQARALVKRAKKALAVAKDLGRNQSFPFGRILREGGSVLETLPLNRLSVSLGHSVDAREGQRFQVFSPKFEGTADIKRPDGGRILGRYPSMIKAEIILIEVQQEMAFAEVLHLHDPAWAVEPGDRLLLAADGESPHADSSQPAVPHPDMLSGLYPHRDFMRHLAAARDHSAKFCLALFRLVEQGRERGQSSPKHIETRIQELTKACRDRLGKTAVGGRFSTSSVIFFLPDTEPFDVLAAMRELCLAAPDKQGDEVCAGLAGYPFLEFSKADVLENCRKALDHAMLLETGPKLALFDSLSLTISADRLFTLGDTYMAMQEYKLALSADDMNILAHNSLAICYAKLGKLAQARSHFEKVLAIEPKNAMALYNYGYVCQRLGETAMARGAYHKCLKLNPEDIFSLLRLGRLAEEKGRLADARKYYLKAAAIPGGEGVTMRHLARLSIRRGAGEEAREYLHKALLYNPTDAFSLHMMAKLYLDSAQDPAIAETMARQSAALRPEQKSFWRELARALTAQGKQGEAAAALAKAEGA
jgi:diguanylate cyclase (GGDEF)-like protein